uniref:ARAD1C22396p n=1 Tax=Blastobotrys adeninivorans TaxID=409370 RepID=A0A060T1P7_BLAAD
MDRTKAFFELNRQLVELLPPDRRSQVATGNNVPDERDKLTAECVDINNTVSELQGNLARIRPLYLATSKRGGLGNSMTDAQRDEVDFETRRIIQQQMARVRQLEELEKERIRRYSNRSALQKFLADPVAQGTNESITLHRQGMLWYLNDKLKTVSDIHASQQHVRLSRQLEKSKSSFHHLPDRPRRPAQVSMDERERENETTDDIDLSPEMRQELENENNALLEELEQSLDKARQAEKSMNEIAQLQTDLAVHLSTQNDMIQNLMDNAEQTAIEVSSANKQLTSAGARNRLASKIIIYASLIIGLILLIYDSIL